MRPPTLELRTAFVLLACLVGSACAAERTGRESSARRAAVPTEARERTEAAALSQAVKAHVEGADRATLERILASRTQGNSHLNQVARWMWTALRTPTPNRPDATNPLEALVWSRIDALVDKPCKPDPDTRRTPRKELEALGTTALDALRYARSDGRLSRCVLESDSICAIDPPACPGDGAYVETLATVGTIAKAMVRDLEQTASDPSDLECGLHGLANDGYLTADPDFMALLATASSHGDVAIPIAIAAYARGTLRVHAVDRLGQIAGAPSAGFLVEEAAHGPVLAARMRAAQHLRTRQDKRWVSFAGKTIDAALRARDAHHERCDSAWVTRELPTLVEQYPRETIDAIAPGFASYAPAAKCEALEAILGTSRPLTEQGAELVAAAMTDLRPVTGRDTIRVESHDWPCSNLTPSDLAAIRIARRVHLSYDCSMSVAQRAEVVETLRKMRGTTPVW